MHTNERATKKIGVIGGPGKDSWAANRPWITAPCRLFAVANFRWLTEPLYHRQGRSGWVSGKRIEMARSEDSTAHRGLSARKGFRLEIVFRIHGPGSIGVRMISIYSALM